MALHQSGSRRMFPRWRMFRQSLEAGELGSLLVTKNISHQHADDFFWERYAAWKVAPSDFGVMAELLSHAMLLRREETIREVLNYSKKVVVPDRLLGLLESAYGFIQNESEESLLPIGVLSSEQLRAFIHLHRRSSRISPFDAISQIEMAWNYLVIGRMDKAERCVLWALRVAPTNRYVLRSACRFYIHRGEHARAKKLLIKSGMSKNDPWIAAALVSVEQALRQIPAHVRSLQELGLDRGISPSARSELLAALADFHNGEGDRKRSKKLFTEALLHPTDNALAQAIHWISKDGHADAEKIVRLAHVKAPFEASALVHYYNNEWDKCLEQLRYWCDDQPFSGRPYIFQSVVLAVMKNDHEGALRVLNSGLIVDPKDPTLQNNKIFSLISIARYEEAHHLLSAVKIDDLVLDAQIALSATWGLYKFRTAKSPSDFDKGREFYAKAIALAKKDPAQKSRGQTAALFQFIEEIRLGAKLGIEEVEAVKEMLSKARDPGVLYMAEKVLSLVKVEGST